MSARKHRTAAPAESAAAEATPAESAPAEATPAEATPAEATPSTEAAAAEAGTEAPATEAAPAAEVAPAAAGASAAGDSRTADFTAGPGGVMTDEAGVVTGDLTLRTELAGGEIVLHVQYKDADEWYVVTGGRAPLKDPADLDTVHTLALALLNRPEG